MVAKEAGSFLGGFFNNPGLVAIALGIGALLVFRKPIQEAFASFGENFGKIPDITLPEIKFPEIKFPEWPEFKFPEWPEFKFPEWPEYKFPEWPQVEDPLNLFDFFNNLFKGNGEGVMQEPLITTTFGTVPESPPPIVIGDFNPFQTIGTETDIIVPKGDELGLGGGPSFISGVTTFGSNIVDSLSEVLNIFPNLTASQARDTLEEFQGLTASQFRLIDPDVINITEPEQIFNVSSGGFTGLSPEQIAKLLTGGNISNF